MKKAEDIIAIIYIVLFVAFYIYFDSFLLALGIAFVVSAALTAVEAVYRAFKEPQDAAVTEEKAKEVAAYLVGKSIDGPQGPAPYGGVIWDDKYTIDELIYKNGKYYINENSEEWEEDEE